MDENTTTRRWWRKKRWWGAGLLWLVGVYVVGYGPLIYAVGRGWVPQSVVDPLATPVAVAARAAGCDAVVESYGRWWFVKALRDDGRTVEVLPDGTIVTTRGDSWP